MAKTRTGRPKEHFYFAFGSCMFEKDLLRTTPCRKIGTATLFDYRLGFTRYSAGRNGGVADVIESPGDSVEGVLFKVTDLKSLDAREGHPFAYKRQKIKVMDNKTLKYRTVWTYIVVNKLPNEIKPSSYYAGLVLKGATQLSQYYQAQLRKNIMQEREIYTPPPEPEPLPSIETEGALDADPLEDYYAIMDRMVKERMQGL